MSSVLSPDFEGVFFPDELVPPAPSEKEQRFREMVTTMGKGQSKPLPKNYVAWCQQVRAEWSAKRPKPEAPERPALPKNARAKLDG